MRASPTERSEIIDLVQNSDLPVKETLKRIGISKSTFYRWYSLFCKYGIDGLKDNYQKNRSTWNAIPEKHRDLVVDVALENPDLSSREIAAKVIDQHDYFVSESSVYRILKERELVQSPCFQVLEAHDKFPEPTEGVHELWQTDFTYFKIFGWGWYYLSTVMDDYSRYIISWELCQGMKATDAIRSIEDALKYAKVTHPNLSHPPKLLSDNGSCYVSSDLKSFLESQEMKHTRGKPYHPMTQGKIERYHRSMKNIIKLEPYFFPEDLKKNIANWVDYYNNRRYHGSLNNLTPADVYFGRDKEILQKRSRLKSRCINERRAIYFSRKIASGE